MVLLNSVLTFWLPLVVMVAGTIVAVVLVCRNRYSRKLALTAPPEETRIQALAASGRISGEEAAMLIERENALPEVCEVSPCPDLPLRIASAFGRIYSLMKFALLGGMALFFWSIHFHASRSGAFHSENLPILVGVGAVILVLAVVEFCASVRILHGSLAARNFLIFNWIVNFALLRAALVGLDSSLYLIPAVAGGGYILHVLLFRRGAAGKIRTGRPETGAGTKAVLGLVLLAALGFGLFFTAVKYKNLSELHSETSTMSSSFSGPVQCRIGSILLIQGTPDRESSLFCELLAGKLAKESGTPCRIHHPGEPVEWHDQMRSLAILVMREPVAIPVTARETLFEKLSGMFQEQWKTAPPRIGIPDGRDEFIRKMKNPVSFSVMTLRGFASWSFSCKGLQLPDRAFTFHLAATGGSSVGVDASVRNLADHAAEKLKPLFEQYRNAPRIGIPAELPFAGSACPPVDPSILEKPELIYRGHSLICSGFYVWRFEMPDPAKDRERIIARLKSAGFQDMGLLQGEIRRFEKGDWEVLLMADKAERRNGVNYGIFICGNNPGEIIQHFPPDREFLLRTAQNDPYSFAIGGGLAQFRGEEFASLFRRILALPGLTLPERMLIFNSIANVGDRGSAGKECTEFQHLLVDDVIAHYDSELFPSNLRQLSERSEQDDALHDYLWKKLPGRMFVDAVLPPVPDEDGRYVLRKRVPCGKLIGSRIILNIAVPGKPSLRYFVGTTRLANGTVRMDVGNGFSSWPEGQQKRSCNDEYFYFSRWKKWDNAGSMSGIDERTEFPDLPEHPRAGQLTIRTKFYPADESYSFGIIYIPESKGMFKNK